MEHMTSLEHKSACRISFHQSEEASQYISGQYKLQLRLFLFSVFLLFSNPKYLLNLQKNIEINFMVLKQCSYPWKERFLSLDFCKLVSLSKLISFSFRFHHFYAKFSLFGLFPLIFNHLKWKPSKDLPWTLRQTYAIGQVIQMWLEKSSFHFLLLLDNHLIHVSFY